MKKSLLSIAMTTCVLSLLPLSLYAAVPVAAADSTPAANTMNSSNMYAFVEGGYDFMSSPDNETVAAPDGNATNSYATDKAHTPMLGLGMGYAFPVSYLPSVIQSNAIELAINHAFSYKFDGTRTEINPNDSSVTGTNDYDYKMNTTRVLLSYIINFNSFAHFSPFVALGAGVEWYTMNNFNENANSSLDVNPETIANNSGSNFAYSAGFGINYQAMQELGLSLGYRFVGAGNAKTGNISYTDGLGQETAGGISNSLNTNEVYLRLSYYFV